MRQNLKRRYLVLPCARVWKIFFSPSTHSIATDFIKNCAECVQDERVISIHHCRIAHRDTSRFIFLCCECQGVMYCSADVVGKIGLLILKKGVESSVHRAHHVCVVLVRRTKSAPRTEVNGRSSRFIVVIVAQYPLARSP